MGLDVFFRAFCKNIIYFHGNFVLLVNFDDNNLN